jgi:hypothetical protein
MRTMRVALLALGCLATSLSSTWSQPIPSPLQGVTMAGRLSQDPTTRIFTFDYRMTNPPVNDGAIFFIALDVSRGPGDAVLSREGLVNGPRYFFNLSEDAFQRVPMVPVGINAPEGWFPALGTSSGDSPPGLAFWGALSKASTMGPGQTVDGYRLTSYGLPAIRAVQVRPLIDWDNLPDEFYENLEKSRALGDSLLFRTSSVGPKAPPQNFVPLEFLNYLIALVHDSRQLGWIKDDGLQQSLLAKLTTAKRKLEASDTASAKNVLGAFLNEVQGASCPDFSCPGNKPLTSEAYALLFFNGQFLVDRLP